MRRLVVFSVLALAQLARADSYGDADESRTVSVGETIDVVPPGVVTQLVCDGVDELISVEAEGMTLHVRGLKAGTAACSISGERDRNDAPDSLAEPDGGRSGLATYRMLVKITVVAKPKASAPKR